MIQVMGKDPNTQSGEVLSCTALAEGPMGPRRWLR